MTTFRDLTTAEEDIRRSRPHDSRSADTFACPHCKADTGLSSFVSDPAACVCPRCGKPFAAWTVPGLIHVTAKLSGI